jgi:hypothetical protein
VVVIAVGGTTGEARTVAREIYRDPALRPPLADAEARVLIGEALPKGASTALAELSSLRARARASTDAADRAILAEIARRTRARAIALVLVTGDGATGDGATGDGATGEPATDAAIDDGAEVRLYDAADDRLEATRHRAEQGGWSSLLDRARARFSTTAPTTTPATAPVNTPTPSDAKKGGTFLSSPWFWGALGAAAAAAVAAWAISRDNAPSSSGVRIEW